MFNPVTNQHPITPPLELVDSIWNQFKTGPTRNLLTSEAFREAITKASQWGADQELEACCKWTAIVGGADALRAARRPKPPSLKEQALKDLDDLEANLKDFGTGFVPITNLRKVLEALPND